MKGKSGRGAKSKGSGSALDSAGGQRDLGVRLKNCAQPNRLVAALARAAAQRSLRGGGEA